MFLQSWDDLVTTPSRTVTIPVGADVNGFRMTALYTQQARLTVGSTLAGQVVTVDGSPCTTPCSVVRGMGAQVRVSAPASVSLNSASRQDFLGWSTNGGAPSPGDWVATLNAASTSISATYHLMNRLTATASPSAGATWSILPASPDGFYDSQTQVAITVTARPGYRFTSWSGDLSGTTPSGSLTMTVPHQVVAQFSTVPYIAPSGVSNGAGSVPQPGVAPGAVATIFGASLASSTAIGPASPMVQTLGGRNGTYRRPTPASLFRLAGADQPADSTGPVARPPDNHRKFAGPARRKLQFQHRARCAGAFPGGARRANFTR